MSTDGSSQSAREGYGRAQAWQLLTEWTLSESLRKHALAVEACVAACGEADTAALALKRISADKPDLVLADISLPDRSGLELIKDVKRRGLPIVLISHNMPHVFEVADRIHIHRLGRRLCVIDPKLHSMSDAVAMMTGAMPPPAVAETA